MFWLEENLILPNVLITGESNFDEKNVEEMFNMCSTDQSFIRKRYTIYKIETLTDLYLYLQRCSHHNLVMPDFEAEFEAELLQQQQKPISAVAETTASVLPSITIDRYIVGDFFVKMSGTIQGMR